MQKAGGFPLTKGIDEYFQENKPIAGLGRATLHSSMIVVAARLVGVALQIASMIILGRLLSPHDFGLTATVFALIAFGPMLIDLGTSEATSQKTHITRAEVSYLFWLNAVISAVLTVLLAASSGLIATFYREPALSGIALVSSLTFIASGISTQHTALLRRSMQFRRLALVDILANVISTILSIAMAFAGWGYWALVAKPVALALLTVVGVWIGCPWMPGRPEQTAEAKASVRFGLGVAGFTLTDTFAQSADRIALGYVYGAGPLGYYQNAYLFYSNLLNTLASPLHNIAVSSLSKLRNTPDQFKKSWTNALSTLSFVSAIAFALVAVTGQDLIVILLGHKWAPAGPVLCIFAIRGIAQTIERSLGWLHVPMGRSDRWMRWGFFSAICQVVAVAVGLPFGLLGVAATSAIVIYLLFIPALVYAGRPAGIGSRDVIATVGPQTAAALVAVVLGLAVREFLIPEFSDLARFFISSTVCSAIYLFIAVGIFRITGPLHLALSVLRDLSSRRSLRSS